MDPVRSLGKLGRHLPLKDISSKTWDSIIVGAGHNGLACAAYLSRAGKKVLVLEASDRVGGACRSEEVFPGVIMSPCAYVMGLMHPLVIQELKLKENGLRWIAADGGMFMPFEDGTYVHLPHEDDACDAEVKKIAPNDLEGWRALRALKNRVRNILRPENDKDIWIGRAPSRQAIEDRLGNDSEAKKLLFEWSMVEFVEHYLSDEKLQLLLIGQGVVGTNSSPYDPGTAFIDFHHSSGRLDGDPGTWGYVVGGMGMISLVLCKVALKEGATILTDTRVSEISHEGVVLESGEKISSRTVVSNADPKTTLRLVGKAAPANWKKQVESIPIEGCTVKVNAVLRQLPNFKARPGVLEPHHYGNINTPLTKREWKICFEDSKNGKLPPRAWTEIYLQTPHDPSVAPPGLHTMSIFSQFVPYRFKEGTWDTRREEAGDMVINSIARFCSNLPDAIIHREVLGPPDIEKKVGLTGGHIFHGECLPAYMWENRLSAKTDIPGVYLCGVGTHPGGSVIGIHGRNAAMEVLGS